MFVRSLLLENAFAYAELEAELKVLFPDLTFVERVDDEFDEKGETISVSVNHRDATFQTELVLWDFPGEPTGEVDLYIATHLHKKLNTGLLIDAEIDDDEWTDDMSVFIYENKLYAVNSEDIENPDYQPVALWEMELKPRKFNTRGLLPQVDAPAKKQGGKSSNKKKR